MAELDPQAATAKAKAMYEWSCSFNGKLQFDSNSSFDRRSLGIALNFLDEATAMVMNLAERVPDGGKAAGAATAERIELSERDIEGLTVGPGGLARSAGAAPDGEAVADDVDPKITVGELAAHVGAWETPDGIVHFGSWMAVSAFRHHILKGAAKQWAQMHPVVNKFGDTMKPEWQAFMSEAHTKLAALAVVGSGEGEIQAEDSAKGER